MQIQLTEGAYSKTDSIDLISKMIEAKIKFHEDKIVKDSSEEDIEYRESKIRQLQLELSLLKNRIGENAQKISIDTCIHVN